MNRPPLSRLGLGTPGARERRDLEELLEAQARAVSADPGLWKRDRIVGELGAAWPLLERIPDAETQSRLRNELDEIHTKLRALDERDTRALRAMVRQAAPSAELVRRVAEHPAAQRDPLLRRVFGIGVPPRPTVALETGMISLVSTNIDTVGELAGRVRPEDTFVDVGCGLGTLALMIRYFTGARVLGVDLEPAYIDAARATAEDLRLEAKFVCSDARAADYREATVFFLYDPFHGEILRQFFETLERDTLARPVRVFAFGRCRDEIAQYGRLEHVTTTRTSVAEFRLTEKARR